MLGAQEDEDFCLPLPISPDYTAPPSSVPGLTAILKCPHILSGICLVPMDLDAHIRTLAHSLDADYFGVADLSSAHDFILAQGGERVARYPRAITIGMVLQDNLVNLLPENDPAAAILYRHNSYDVVNIALDQIGAPGGKHAPAGGIRCVSDSGIKADG